MKKIFLYFFGKEYELSAQDESKERMVVVPKNEKGFMEGIGLDIALDRLSRVPIVEYKGRPRLWDGNFGYGYVAGFDPYAYAAKPPLGLMPRKIYEDKTASEVSDNVSTYTRQQMELKDRSRVSDIEEAMQRYWKAGMSVPQEWWDELQDLKKKLK